MQKIWAMAMLPLLAACGGSADDEAPPEESVMAELMKGDEKIGEVTLTQLGGSVAMSIRAGGLKSGSYGMHIHETGKCEGPDYKSAGGHWNPGGKAHGTQNTEGGHAGDLENLFAATGQDARMERNLPGITIFGEGGLMDDDGAALVIHAGPDDMKSDPSGNSGDRIICGVFNKVE